MKIFRLIVLICFVLYGCKTKNYHKVETFCMEDELESSLSTKIFDNTIAPKFYEYNDNINIPIIRLVGGEWNYVFHNKLIKNDKDVFLLYFNKCVSKMKKEFSLLFQDSISLSKVCLIEICNEQGLIIQKEFLERDFEIDDFKVTDKKYSFLPYKRNDNNVSQVSNSWVVDISLKEKKVNDVYYYLSKVTNGELSIKIKIIIFYPPARTHMHD